MKKATIVRTQNIRETVMFLWWIIQYGYNANHLKILQRMYKKHYFVL